jgi:hypothetical protein
MKKRKFSERGTTRESLASEAHTCYQTTVCLWNCNVDSRARETYVDYDPSRPFVYVLLYPASPNILDYHVKEKV